MKNLDILAAERAALGARLAAAIKEDKPEAFGEAWADFAQAVQEAVIAEAHGMISAQDGAVLMGRGVRVLTSEETTYYNKIIEAMRSATPQQSVTMIDEAMPKTILDQVLEDVTEAHPLLDLIDFQSTGALTDIIVSSNSRLKAGWGALTDTVTTELSSTLLAIPLSQKKCSAFIPVAKAMLDIGPVWIDKYVRTMLAESISNGAEDGAINGTGVEMPIGMRYNPAGSFDQTTGYPLLSIGTLSAINPTTFGTILGGLAQNRNGLYRAVTEVIFLVNPVTYFTKVMPAVTYQAADGTWVERFPFPTKVIQSAYMPVNEAVIGIGKQYFMGLGTSKGGKLEFSDHVKFIEDSRVYLIKLYGDGRPKDNVSFKRLDISALLPEPRDVRITNATLNAAITNDTLYTEEYEDARLVSLAIGALTLSPTFDRDKKAYTATSTTATNTITALAKDGDATIAIKNGETTVANGAAATWATGENTVTVTVTVGNTVEVYTVTVTKSE